MSKMTSQIVFLCPQPKYIKLPSQRSKVTNRYSHLRHWDQGTQIFFLKRLLKPINHLTKYLAVIFFIADN